jgi:hypothetical protein
MPQNNETSARNIDAWLNVAPSKSAHEKNKIQLKECQFSIFQFKCANKGELTDSFNQHVSHFTERMMKSTIIYS